MTDREKAIVMAYTGKCMLTGDKFQIFHKYVEDIMGRPIWTHEMGLLADEIKGKSEADFMALCAEEPKTDGDCISRQTTVEFLEKHAETYEDVRVKMGFKASASLINNRNNLPSVTPTQDWIPISERLPEENGNYLVTIVSSDKAATITYISVDHYGPNWLHEDKHRTVIAWMPLPELYKESEEKPIYSGKFEIGGWFDADGNSVSEEVEQALNKILPAGDKPNEDTVEIPYTTEALEPTCISIDGGTASRLWGEGDNGSIICLICGCEMWENDLIDGKANYCPNCGSFNGGAKND